MLTERDRGKKSCGIAEHKRKGPDRWVHVGGYL